MTHAATPLARPVSLDAARNATVDRFAGRFHPAYGPALARLPAGRQVFHGLPFDLGPAGHRRRWILLDGPQAIDLSPVGPARYLVIAHLCDTWRDDAGERPPGLALGHVVPVGEPLARYTVLDRSGARTRHEIRRRFEVNDGILGWGSTAFAALPHVENEAIDWRGPHAAQSPGRYAPAGQSGTLTIMPGVYGTSQTGVSDFVPSATDDALLWLVAIELEAGAEPMALELEPLAGGRPGSDLVVAAVTAFSGGNDPLLRSPRFQVRLDGGDEPAGVDLGTIIRSRPAPAAPTRADEARRPIGWGTPRADGTGGTDRDPHAGSARGAQVVDLSIAPDGLLRLGDLRVTGRELLGDGPRRHVAGPRSIEVLPPPEIPVRVEIVDPAGGERLPARVRFTTPDGRYLPPAGHRDEVNPAFYEDSGADLVLGSSTYAYVPGDFEIDLPRGTVEVEVVAGFERRPIVQRLEIDPSTRRLELALEHGTARPPGRWISADSHVHFLAPSTALLQAAAEDVHLVNLLAAQWGDLFTNVTDLPWGSIQDPAGRRQVIVGTENRQNVLGHLALLGAHRATTPFASGGPPEGRMAGALSVLLADWADRCRAAGGLVVAAHFPLPYAEIGADILAGKIDAIESQALSPGLDDPAIFEWYRFLNLGDRLPIVAGTDKMSAEVPIGAVRTYTHLLDDEPLSFAGWAAAVRAGRTFVSSGPILELQFDGHEPGAVITMASAGHLQVSVVARASQPVINVVELVVNGRIVAATSPTSAGVLEQRLDETIEVRAGSWVAARCRSTSEIQSAFTTSMAAHTSAVYIEVDCAPLVPPAADGAAVAAVIDGARTWVAGLAAVADPAERERMVRFFDASLELLRLRMLGRP